MAFHHQPSSGLPGGGPPAAAGYHWQGQGQGQGVVADAGASVAHGASRFHLPGTGAFLAHVMPPGGVQPPAPPRHGVPAATALQPAPACRLNISSRYASNLSGFGVTREIVQNFLDQCQKLATEAGAGETVPVFHTVRARPSAAAPPPVPVCWLLGRRSRAAARTAWGRLRGAIAVPGGTAGPRQGPCP